VLVNKTITSTTYTLEHKPPTMPSALTGLAAGKAAGLFSGLAAPSHPAKGRVSS
jgi:hypothetical protein